jgi:hypothetical protein
MRRYAICRKVKLFKLFDQGKRPSDLPRSPVSRKTLYQYYGEWRKERGIEGRKTGFAIKVFDRKAYLAQNREKQRQKSQQKLMTLVTSWEATLAALKDWDGESEKKVYIPGKGYYRLGNLLRLKVGSKPGTYARMTREENIAVFEKWVKLGKEATDLAVFEELCRRHKAGYPSEIEGGLD